MLVQFGKGIFEQFDDVFKVLVASVIGVRNFVSLRMVAQKVGKHHHLSAFVVATGLPKKVSAVFGIHHQYQVKVGKISAGVELARPVGESITMLAAMLPHSSVGQVANMPAADAGRINFKAISVVMPVNNVLHDGMGCR